MTDSVPAGRAAAVAMETRGVRQSSSTGPCHPRQRQMSPRASVRRCRRRRHRRSSTLAPAPYTPGLRPPSTTEARRKRRADSFVVRWWQSNFSSAKHKPPRPFAYARAHHTSLGSACV